MTYPSLDSSHIESATVSSTTPLLHRNSTQGKNQKRSHWFFRFIHFFGGGIYAPDASTYEPIEMLLNTSDPEEQDRLTELWRDNRLNELNFVGVVAALLAGVLTSTGSWPTILPNGQKTPWPIRTAWYCGIILSLFSLLTAADQTVRLHRLSSHQQACKRIRNLLARTRGKERRCRQTGRVLPNPLQVYTWQLPVMFLTTAAIAMIVGMFLQVWAATRELRGGEWWDDNSKVAVTYTTVAVVSILLFFTGQVTLYAPDSVDLD